MKPPHRAGGTGKNYPLLPPCFPSFNFQSTRSHGAPAWPGVTRIHGRLDCTLSRIDFKEIFSDRFVTQSLAKGFTPFGVVPPTVLAFIKIPLTVFTNLALENLSTLPRFSASQEYPGLDTPTYRKGSTSVPGLEHRSRVLT